MKRNMFKYLKSMALIAIVSIVAVSCTDLEIEETESINTEEEAGIFDGVADVEAALNNLYNDTYGQLGDQANFYALQQVSTDETLVPTRGTDWGDNGIWRTLHAHTWSPTHQFILNVWNNLNQNVFRATEIISDLSSPNPQQKAEAQFLRAFSMFFVVDMWGVQPFREPTEGADIDPVVLTAAEAYNLMIEDLTAARDALPSGGPSADNNRATKAAANYLLAKVRLNAGRYKGTGGFDNGDMQAVIDAVDAIAADGYALQAGYFDIFKEDVDSETIWFANTSVGNRIWNGLHYNQISPDNEGGGWNGFTTLAEFYDAFEGNPDRNEIGDSPDERRGFVPTASTSGPENLGIGFGFLIGQQFDVNGNPLSNRSGQPLNYTRDLPGLNGNTEETGIRVIKYHPVNGAFTNHEIVFRYADAHLMKAEAMFRSGAGDALSMVNELRTLRGASALGNLSEADLLAERGRELYNEFWRRNDMVRFGQYTRDWDYKNPEAVGADFRNLYPIPINALLSNPNLQQNEGY